MLDEVLDIRLQSEFQLPIPALAADDRASDDRLAELALAGDETAFEEIFDRYKRHVIRTVGRFFADPAEVEEHVQQAFVKAYTSLSRYRGGESNSFAAWLTRITVNVCYDELRRRQRRGQSLFSDMSRDDVDYVETVVDGRVRNEAENLGAREIALKILATLDPMDRVAITMVYTDDRPLEEVAKSIGISKGSLKSRLFRCRQQIKRRFAHLL